MSLDIKFCTPSEGSTTSFKCLMFSFERDCIRLAPLTTVFATSKAKIEILFPFVVTPEVKPPLVRFKLVMLLPSVSNTSYAFPSPTVPALPNSELTSETCNTEITSFLIEENPYSHILKATSTSISIINVCAWKKILYQCIALWTQEFTPCALPSI